MSHHRKDTLFLHMGPGFSCYIENKVLGPIFPNTLYWDQPIITSEYNAFLELAQKVANQIQQMQKESGNLIHIQAHSFSGHIIDFILQNKMASVASCEIYNTSFNMIDGYLNLLKTMQNCPQTDVNLKLKIQTFLNSNTNLLSSSQLFTDIISLVSADPLFVKHYFNNTDKFNSYLKVAVNAPPFNLEMFKNVLVDFMDHHFDKDYIHKVNEQITFYLNTADPFYLPKSELLWQIRYPTAKIILTTKIGHFIHLEEHL